MNHFIGLVKICRSFFFGDDDVLRGWRDGRSHSRGMVCRADEDIALGVPSLEDYFAVDKVGVKWFRDFPLVSAIRSNCIATSGGVCRQAALGLKANTLGIDLQCSGDEGFISSEAFFSFVV